jgi:hypothetical protein
VGAERETGTMDETVEFERVIMAVEVFRLVVA